jgi:DNA-binding GntR family transcriptional regulator
LSFTLRSLKRNQPLQEQVYQALRTAILSGELVAGARLVETQLATKLQVSRTPIREALRLLQHDNLVEVGESGALRIAILVTDHRKLGCGHAFRDIGSSVR